MVREELDNGNGNNTNLTAGNFLKYNCVYSMGYFLNFSVREGGGMKKGREDGKKKRGRKGRKGRKSMIYCYII